MTSRAVVLGGGGVAGVAWEIGLLAGLVAEGVDLTGADAVVGTSAGSVVGAELAAGLDPAQLYTAQLADPGSEIAARVAWSTLLRWGWATAETVPEAARRAVIESRLPVREWPDRRLLITAVDAESGEFMVFDRDSGVGLIDAIGASCAVPGVWPPVTIDGHRYIDGGVRSAANVDLAAGYDRVVVIAPLPGGAGPVPSVVRQAAALDGRVAVVTPDRDAKRAFGRNVLDPARRAPAARAGRAQAAAEAARVRQVWTGDGAQPPP